jgi:hypothetical protein
MINTIANNKKATEMLLISAQKNLGRDSAIYVASFIPLLA